MSGIQNNGNNGNPSSTGLANILATLVEDFKGEAAEGADTLKECLKDRLEGAAAGFIPADNLEAKELIAKANDFRQGALRFFAEPSEIFAPATDEVDEFLIDTNPHNSANNTAYAWLLKDVYSASGMKFDKEVESYYPNANGRTLADSFGIDLSEVEDDVLV